LGELQRSQPQRLVFDPQLIRDRPMRDLAIAHIEPSYTLRAMAQLRATGWTQRNPFSEQGVTAVCGL